MFKRIFRVAAATLVFVFCVAAARAEVRIGVALPRTGPLASIGEQIANGVTAAVKAINENAPGGREDRARYRGRCLRPEAGGLGRQ